MDVSRRRSLRTTPHKFIEDGLDVSAAGAVECLASCGPMRRCGGAGGELGCNTAGGVGRFLGGPGVVKGAGPIREIGVVEHPGQVTDGVAGVGEDMPAGAGVVVQERVEVAGGPAVPGWQRQQRRPRGGGLELCPPR